MVDAHAAPHASAKPLREVVSDALRGRIVSGVLPPGTRVREEALADEFGVSRVPVREALQRLEGEGYLVLTPRRGATVAAPSPDRALEVMEVRRVLEVLAVRRAAADRGAAVVDELRRVVRDGQRAVARRDHAVIPELIDRFHALVALGSGNGELVELLTFLRHRVRWMFEVDLDDRSEKSWSDHAAILEAIASGEADVAAELMDRHVARDEVLYRAKAHRA